MATKSQQWFDATYGNQRLIENQLILTVDYVISLKIHFNQ